MKQTPSHVVLIPEHEFVQQNAMLQSIIDTLNKIDFDRVLRPQEYLSVKDVCKIYSMSRSYFEILKRDGTIKTYKVSGKIYVKSSEIKEVFESARQ